MRWTALRHQCRKEPDPPRLPWFCRAAPAVLLGAATGVKVKWMVTVCTMVDQDNAARSVEVQVGGPSAWWRAAETVTDALPVPSPPFHCHFSGGRDPLGLLELALGGVARASLAALTGTPSPEGVSGRPLARASRHSSARWPPSYWLTKHPSRSKRHSVRLNTATQVHPYSPSTSMTSPRSPESAL